MPTKLALVVLLSMAGCVSALDPIEPKVSYLSQIEGEAALIELEGKAPLTAFDGLMVHSYPAAGPRAVVVFVHGLGTNAKLWDLPKVGGLARRVWRAGYAVYSVDLVSTGDAQPYEAGKRRLGQLLTILGKRHLGTPLIGVGHDMGGTLLYALGAELGSPLAGVVGIGAPVAFGGYSKAVTQLLDAPSRLDKAALYWAEIDPLSPAHAFANEATLTELLLTTELPRRERQAFFADALRPMTRAWLEELAARGRGHEVPSLHTAFRGERRQYPILAIMAPSDGLMPPWLCDWRSFGVMDAQIERIFLTRSNGNAMEYNHLDMVLHPWAQREVYPRVLGWIEAQTGR